MTSAIQLLKQPFLTFGRRYNAAAQKNPFTVGTVTTLVKTSGADLFAQKVGLQTRELVCDPSALRHGLSGEGTRHPTTRPCDAPMRRAHATRPCDAPTACARPCAGHGGQGVGGRRLAPPRPVLHLWALLPGETHASWRAGGGAPEGEVSAAAARASARSGRRFVITQRSPPRPPSRNPPSVTAPGRFPVLPVQPPLCQVVPRHHAARGPQGVGAHQDLHRPGHTVSSPVVSFPIVIRRRSRVYVV
jgi:hypothetical protein